MKRAFVRALALAFTTAILASAFTLTASADTVTATIKAAIGASVQGSADFANPKFDLPPHADIVMLSGTADGKSDLLFADQRTLTASSNEDIDLSGSLTTPVGSSAVFVDVTAILIRAASANTNTVQIKTATTNGFVGPFNAAADVVAVQPGGAALFVAPNTGWPVTATTADLLNIANGGAGTSVVYDIIVVGRSS